tara:strand:+ start:38 stop:409 length:372 start_codon:yes stop_codon:yes gene_type:complete
MSKNIDEYIEMWDDNLLGSEGVQILMNTLIAEVKRLRELLYKCWKDSGQSLYYLQVELLNDQEYWYEQMICDDDSKRCGDYGIEDCECDDDCSECYGTGGLRDSHLGINDECPVCAGTGRLIE